MIYRGVQLIQILLAHEGTDERTEVFKEVLADLKTIELTCKLDGALVRRAELIVSN